MHKNFCILISGPTATGKTDLATSLTATLPIEIVNADIGSFYSNLTIGTAKPAWKESSIPHHFFDIIHDASSLTAPQFRQNLQILMHDIWSRGNIPVIVGGSAFYIQAFFYKNHELDTPAPGIVESLGLQSADNLWKQLSAIDPDRAAHIDPHDHYRLVRALAIWSSQGRKPSEFVPLFEPLSPFYFVTLTRDRDQLYTMINQRVCMMMEAGWLDEVRSLLDDDSMTHFLLKKKMIGYDLLAQYLLGHQSEQSIQDIILLIQQRTRNYAKRQTTFLKKLQLNVLKSMQVRNKDTRMPYEIEECNLTLCDLSLYIKQLSERISQFLR